MNRFDPRRSRRLGRSTAPAAVLAITLGLGLAAVTGCAPKISNVDASYTMPEGTPSAQTQLILWQDQPTTAYYYVDHPPADPSDMDSLIDVRPFERYSPGTIQGMILDGTPADAFQTF